MTSITVILADACYLARWKNTLLTGPIYSRLEPKLCGEVFHRVHPEIVG
jgi:hypothetical protein